MPWVAHEPVSMAERRERIEAWEHQWKPNALQPADLDSVNHAKEQPRRRHPELSTLVSDMTSSASVRDVTSKVVSTDPPCACCSPTL
jgi:hypothetical protein